MTVSLFILAYFFIGAVLWFCVDFVPYTYGLEGSEILGFIVAWPFFMLKWVWLGIKFFFVGWAWCIVNMVDGVMGANEVFKEKHNGS